MEHVIHRCVTFCSVFVLALILLSGVAAALSPPHSPALHFSADYFTGSLGLPDGTPLDNPASCGGSCDWIDNISGVVATPNGVDMSVHKYEANSHPVVRDGIGVDGAPGNNQWWVSDAEMLAKAPNLLSGTNDYTIISVMRGADPIPDVNNMGVAAVWGPTATHNTQWYMSAEPDPPVGSGGYQRTFQFAGASTFSSLSNTNLTTADLTGDWHAWGWVKSGGATPILEVHTDGITSAISGGTTLADLGTHDQGEQGRRLNFHGGQGPFFGDLAEIIFYDRALNTTELADLDAYLDAKYFDPLPVNDADFDDNSTVDGFDFLQWQIGQGTDAGAGNFAPHLDGNANGDQFINGTDLGIWESQYGGPPPVSAVTVVPEPSSLLLVLLAGCALVDRRWKSRFAPSDIESDSLLGTRQSTPMVSRK